MRRAQKRRVKRNILRLEQALRTGQKISKIKPKPEPLVKYPKRIILPGETT